MQNKKPKNGKLSYEHVAYVIIPLLTFTESLKVLVPLSYLIFIYSLIFAPIEWLYLIMVEFFFLLFEMSTNTRL